MMIRLTRIWEGVRSGETYRITWHVNPDHIAFIRRNESGWSIVVIGQAEYVFEESPDHICDLIERSRL